MSEEQFKNIFFCIKSNHSESGEAIDKKFNHSDFSEVQDTVARKSLLMFAAYKVINSIEREQGGEELELAAKNLSLSYKVPCEGTEMIGVVKPSDGSAEKCILADRAFREGSCYM